MVQGSRREHPEYRQPIGPSQTAVIAAILEHEPPPVARFVSNAPAALDWTIARCVAKDPDDRWQSAADLKHHLDWLATSTEPPRRGVSRGRSPIWIAGAIVLATVFLGTWAWRQRSSNAAAAPAVFAVEPPAGSTFDLTQALSRDGRRIAFTAVRADGTRELWVRSLDALTAQRIAESEGAAHPFWSPDGRFVGFFGDRKLKRWSWHPAVSR